MTRAEIDILWQCAMAQSVKDGEMFTRYHFAKLIADAERERIKTSRPPRVSVALERARQEEREACAKLCDERSAGWDQVKIVRDDVEACMNAAAKNEARALGAAIRARAELVTREQRRAHDEQHLTRT